VRKKKDEFDLIDDLDLIDRDPSIGIATKALLQLPAFRRRAKKEADRIRGLLRAARDKEAT
jgi:hypothetical protein